MDHPSHDEAGLEELSRGLIEGLRRRGVDRHTAEDALQEAWLRTLRSRDRAPRQLREWLRVVSRRVLDEFSRKGRARTRRERVAAIRESVPAPLPHQQSRVLELVQALPEPYREVLWLRFVEDVPIERIAQQLGRPAATVRSQLKRGLDRLRTRLDSEAEREDRGLLAALLSLVRPAGSRSWRSVALWTSGAVVVLLAVWIASSGETRARVEGAGAKVALAGERDEPRALVPSARVPVDSGSAPASSPAALDGPARPASGTVRAPDGTPFVGARIWRGSSDGRSAEPVAVSDWLGNFSIKHVELMELLWASSDVHLPSPRIHVASGSGARVDLWLQESSGQLELALRDTTGRALVGLPVELEWDRDLAPTELVVTETAFQLATRSLGGVTDASGRLSIPKPDHASARVRVRREDRPPLVRDIELRPGVQFLEVEFPEPLRLTGTVFDERGLPAPGAIVHVGQNARDPDTVAVADAQGRFRMDGLDPGQCAWTVHEDPALGCAAATGHVVLDPGEPPVDLRVELTSLWAIRGRVLRNGAPAEGIPVGRAESIFADVVARTDAEGRFALPCYAEKQCAVKVGRSSGEWSDLVIHCPRGTQDLAIELADAHPVVRRTIEFVGDDPSLIPTLVELRVRELEEAVIRPVDRALRRCEVAVPLGANVSCVAMVPGLGPWRIPDLDFTSAELVRIEVVRPASVTFELESLDGAVPDRVEASLQLDTFGRGLYDSTLRTITRLALSPGPLPGSFSARVPPGSYAYSFRAEGLTHLPGKVAVRAGEVLHERVTLARGVTAEVDVTLGEDRVAPRLFFETAGGARSQLVAAPVRADLDRARFTILLPDDAVAIVATTTEFVGRVTVDRAALGARDAPARFEIVLEAR